MALPTLYTLGHSIRPLEVLLAILEAYGIRHVADVRRSPRSRRHPHFAAERLAPALAERGIGSTHLPAWPPEANVEEGRVTYPVPDLFD